jgi:hypothetical protein
MRWRRSSLPHVQREGGEGLIGSRHERLRDAPRLGERSDSFRSIEAERNR